MTRVLANGESFTVSDVTSRWLSEPCPGERLDSGADAADLKTGFR
jgi:hypothetical protein